MTDVFPDLGHLGLALALFFLLFVLLKWNQRRNLERRISRGLRAYASARPAPAAVPRPLPAD